MPHACVNELGRTHALESGSQFASNIDDALVKHNTDLLLTMHSRPYYPRVSVSQAGNTTALPAMWLPMSQYATYMEDYLRFLGYQAGRCAQRFAPRMRSDTGGRLLRLWGCNTGCTCIGETSVQDGPAQIYLEGT